MQLQKLEASAKKRASQFEKLRLIENFHWLRTCRNALSRKNFIVVAQTLLSVVHHHAQ